MSRLETWIALGFAVGAIGINSGCRQSSGIRTVLDNPDLTCQKRVSVSGYAVPTDDGHGPGYYTLMDKEGNKLLITARDMPALGQHLTVEGSAVCLTADDGKAHVSFFREYSRGVLPGGIRIVQNGRLPDAADGAWVLVVGCLSRSSENEWKLNNATDPELIPRGRAINWNDPCPVRRRGPPGDFAEYCMEEELKAAARRPLGSGSLLLSSNIRVPSRNWAMNSNENEVPLSGEFMIGHKVLVHAEIHHGPFSWRCASEQDKSDWMCSLIMPGGLRLDSGRLWTVSSSCP